MKLKRAQKRKIQDDLPSSTRQSSGAASSMTKEVSCFFCSGATGTLHQASTFNVDARVRECAHQLQDEVLIAKLSAGDLISQEGVYHAKCLVLVYNKAERLNQNPASSDEKVIQGMALAQLVAYLEETRAETADSISVFTLAELTAMDTRFLKHYGSDLSGRVHSTDLKERILAKVPGLQAHKKGRDIVMAFSEDVGKALELTRFRDFDDEAIILLKASKIIRRDIIATKTQFSGTFDKNSQQESIPQSLKTLIGLILEATDIKTLSSRVSDAQPTLSISQLMLFNTSIRCRCSEATGSAYYHSRDREPPLPIYLGLMTHAETRKRTLVDKLYSLGLSISYDRVLELSTDLGNTVCSRFESEGVVCPPKLNKGEFTTAAMDNIDHNPSSTTAQGAFHGTGISLFQHPSDDAPGEARDVVSIDNQPSKRKRLSQLPDSYTLVKPVILSKNDVWRAAY